MILEFDLEHIDKAATRCWKAVGEEKVIAFHGNMGAGKTTFIRALCKQKQVSSVISSPTFSIINEYEYPEGKIYHIDLYRLQSEEEAIRAGVEDCLFSGNICLVEWPEKAKSIFPEHTIHIFIDPQNEKTRKLSIE